MKETLSLAAPPQEQPVWRREPYRLLFPLGVVLGQLGVVHWLLYALGIASSWRSTFHALTQVEGFLLCFALGFLYTFVPRRTGTLGPSAVQLGVSMLLPALMVASAWAEWWKLSQGFFLAQVGVVLAFVLPRFLTPSPGRTVPEGLVWVPLSLLMGAVGSLLSVAPLEGARWLHGLGTGLLLQGLFTGLVLGVGSTLLPVFLHGEPPEVYSGRARLVRQSLHLAAALLFVASFVLELRVDSRLGHALRAVVAAAALVGPTRLWRPPSAEGLHRWLIWCSAWLLPLGYVVVALRPELRTAGLHVVFLGSFGLMALAISVHVVLSHGGYNALLEGHPWQVVVLGVMVLVALVTRLLVAFSPAHLRLWLGCAAGAFLVATLAWCVLLLPRVRSTPAPHG